MWRGLDIVRAAASSERLPLTGDRRLAADMREWLGLSRFAAERKLAN